jgi:hypothetical protein
MWAARGTPEVNGVFEVGLSSNRASEVRHIFERIVLLNYDRESEHRVEDREPRITVHRRRT